MNHDIRTGLITAALMLGGSMALAQLEHAGVVHGAHRELSTRGVNVLIGLMTVGIASAGAKRLRPLAGLQDPALEQSTRRFVAWTLTIGALLYAMAWLVAPYELAFYLSLVCLGGAVLLSVSRCVTVRGHRRRS